MRQRQQCPPWWTAGLLGAALAAGALGAGVAGRAAAPAARPGGAAGQADLPLAPPDPLLTAPLLLEEGGAPLLPAPSGRAEPLDLPLDPLPALGRGRAGALDGFPTLDPSGGDPAAAARAALRAALAGWLSLDDPTPSFDFPPPPGDGTAPPAPAASPGPAAPPPLPDAAATLA